VAWSLENADRERIVFLALEDLAFYWDWSSVDPTSSTLRATHPLLPVGQMCYSYPQVRF